MGFNSGFKGLNSYHATSKFRIFSTLVCNLQTAFHTVLRSNDLSQRKSNKVLSLSPCYVML